MVDLFRTRDHVPGFDLYVSGFVERSSATRAALRCQLDVSYGSGASERLDLFFPSDEEGPAPVHLFVHGGYWRMFSKSDFSFVADTVTAAGGIAAIMDYSLMPTVRMATIVDQVTRAARWLTSNAHQFGGNGARLSVSGHSAGAHLCALLLQEGGPVQPTSALLLSGIYELEPLRQSFLQSEIGLTDEEAANFSPLRLPIRPPGSLQIMVGGTETEPFHQQAKQFAEACKGASVQFRTVPNGNHMSVALDLGDPNSDVGAALVSTCI